MNIWDLLSRLLVIFITSVTEIAATRGISPGGTRTRVSGPVIQFRGGLNWLMDEYSADHWIHITLNSSNIHIDPPTHPISISWAHGQYQMPSRYLQVRLVNRIMIHLYSQYNEPAVNPKYDMDYFDDRQRDCMTLTRRKVWSVSSSYRPGEDPCFAFPTLYILWTSSFEEKYTAMVSYGIGSMASYPELKYIIFKTELEQNSGNLAFYGVKSVYGAMPPFLLTDLVNCTGIQLKGACRQEIQAVNQELERADAGDKLERQWGIYKELGEQEKCEWTAGEPHRTLDSFLLAVSNLTRVPPQQFNITDDPFEPEPVGLDAIIKYLIVSEVEFEYEDPRCAGMGLGSDASNVTAANWVDNSFDWLRQTKSSQYQYHLTAGDMVLVKSEDQFIATCDGSRKELSFRFFLDPYDETSWMLTIVTVGIITVLFMAVAIIKGPHVIRDNIWTLLYKLLEIGFGVLIGVPPIVPRRLWSSKLLATFFILTFGLWTLLSNILNGAYKGLFISELTAAIPMISHWESIAELEDFTFYAWRTEAIPNLWLAQQHVELLREPGYLYTKKAAELEESLAKKDCDLIRNPSETYLKTTACSTFLKLMETGIKAEEIPKWGFWFIAEKNGSEETRGQGDPNPIPKRTVFASKLYPFGGSWEEYGADNCSNQGEIREFLAAVTSCHKTGIFERNEQLGYFVEYAQLVKGVTLFQIGENVGTERTSYEFGHEFAGKVSRYAYKRLQHILASGIYGLWEKWYNWHYPDTWQAEWQRVRYARDGEDVDLGDENGPKALSMDSNLQTAFYLMFYGCLSGLASFVLEVAWVGVWQELNKCF